MPKANHIHRYKKVNLGQNGKVYLVYACTKALCSHYLPLHLAQGKDCECNRCHDVMVLETLQLRGTNGRAMTRPHCAKCVRKKDKSVSPELLKQMMEKLG